METIESNMKKVRENIARAAEKSGRSADEIILVAVTKTRTPNEMLEAVAAGAFHLGENKVQELESKYEEVTKTAEITCKTERIYWHFIGHLQRNKVKFIINKTDLIHSVDSLRLAEEIDRRAKEAGRVVDVLIQVNAAHEETKFGVTEDETYGLIKSVSETCKNVRIKGLMCIAPAADDPNDVREVFRTVKKMFDEIARTFSAEGESVEMKWLSMGMTHDYEAAIEEGANIVRVGTGIFGERNYPAV